MGQHCQFREDQDPSLVVRNSDRKCNQVGPLRSLQAGRSACPASKIEKLQRVLELEHGAEAEQDGLYQLHAAFVRVKPHTSEGRKVFRKFSRVLENGNLI